MDYVDVSFDCKSLFNFFSGARGYATVCRMSYLLLHFERIPARRKIHCEVFSRMNFPSPVRSAFSSEKIN